MALTFPTSAILMPYLVVLPLLAGLFRGLPGVLVTMLAQVASIVVVPLASSGFVDAGARAIDLAPWLLTNFGGGLLGVWARTSASRRSPPTRTATTSPRGSSSPSSAASPGACRPASTPTAWRRS